MLIGLTGKYCSGKNFIASLIGKKGIPVLDIDLLGHKVLDTEKEAIFSQFGSDLKLPDGSLNRKLLGKMTFGNHEKLSALENIVHPAVNRLTEEWIQAYRKSGRQQGNHLVLNAALLHRSAVFNKLDRIIIVKAPFLIRFFRAKKRDKLSFIEIIKRFASQKDFDTQYLTANAEIYIVKNSKFAKAKIAKAERGQSSIQKQIDEFLKGII